MKYGDAERSIADIHIFASTDHKNTWFLKKVYNAEREYVNIRIRNYRFFGIPDEI